MTIRADIGSKYHTREFYFNCVGFAALACQRRQAAEINIVLPGLGIPSRVAIIADDVPVGGHQQPWGELAIVNVGIVDAATGTLRALLLVATQLLPGSKTGDRKRDLLLHELRRHPLGWDLPALRQRVACLSGDGQLARGGPRARHGSPGALNKLWESLHGTAQTDGTGCVTWDGFHRLERAYRRAQRSYRDMTDVLALGRDLHNMFGAGEGLDLWIGLMHEKEDREGTEGRERRGGGKERKE